MSKGDFSITAQPLKRFYSQATGLAATFESVFIQATTRDPSWEWLQTAGLHISFYELGVSAAPILALGDIGEAELKLADISDSKILTHIIKRAPFRLLLSVFGHPEINKAIVENMSAGLTEGGPLLSAYMHLDSLMEIQIAGNHIHYLSPQVPEIGWVKRTAR